jgi:hypothetical protein
VQDDRRGPESHQCPSGQPTTRERIARIFKECSGVWGQSGISSWERDRLEEWRNRVALSEKQEAILRNIEKKAFPE